MEKKKPKAIDEVKQWLKENCLKGEFVQIHSSPHLLIITKANDVSFAYKLNKKS